MNPHLVLSNAQYVVKHGDVEILAEGSRPDQALSISIFLMSVMAFRLDRAIKQTN